MWPLIHLQAQRHPQVVLDVLVLMLFFSTKGARISSAFVDWFRSYRMPHEVPLPRDNFSFKARHLTSIHFIFTRLIFQASRNRGVNFKHRSCLFWKKTPADSLGLAFKKIYDRDPPPNLLPPIPFESGGRKQGGKRNFPMLILWASQRLHILCLRIVFPLRNLG